MAAEKTKQMKISSEGDNTKAEYVFREAQERTKQTKVQAEEKRKETEATECTKQLQAKKEILAQCASVIENMANIGIDKTMAASLITKLIGTFENPDRASDHNTLPNTLPKIKEEPNTVYRRVRPVTAPV